MLKMTKQKKHFAGNKKSRLRGNTPIGDSSPTAGRGFLLSGKKIKKEKCNRCGIKNERALMYHIQLGFKVVWCCKDRTACAKRVKKIHA